MILFLNNNIMSVSAQELSIDISSIDINNRQLYSDVLIWKYKTVNGQLFKRLYNSSKKVWIGDWILVK